MFDAVAGELGGLPLVAEDLGVITPAVERLRERLGLPGMVVLQFAFGGGPRNPHRPENHRRNLVVYGGGGVVLPFVGIKVIDVIVNVLHLA